MATKVFAEKGRVKLIGDDRDIGVATWDRDAVWTWCETNKITAMYQGTMSGTDVWRIRDERQRLAFILRWQQ